MHNQSQISRRDALRASMWVGAASLFGAGGIAIVSADDHPVAPPRPGGVRFAHLTDMHVQPELRAGEGWAAALRSLQKLDPKPQFIITGGDHVMDALEQTPQRCAEQWDLYFRVLKDNTDAGIPIHPVLGNHDVAGWTSKDKFAADAQGYGKAMALDRLGLKSTWYSFDVAGWHFVALDSILRRDESYCGALGEEQAAWLKADLASVKPGTPICVITHFPIVSICAFFFGDRLKEKAWSVPDSLVHRDTREIAAAIEQHDVRLLLSGHLHLGDRCEFRGKTFISDGAISGNWWKGPHHGFPEGYGIVDLWPDGTFEHQYVTYGWKAES